VATIPIEYLQRVSDVTFFSNPPIVDLWAESIQREELRVQTAAHTPVFDVASP
jgi:hypothetical protein